MNTLQMLIVAAAAIGGMILIDVLRIRATRFELAGMRKSIWMIAPLVGFFAFYAPIVLVAIAWFGRARPRLMAIDPSEARSIDHAYKAAAQRAGSDEALADLIAVEQLREGGRTTGVLTFDGRVPKRASDLQRLGVEVIAVSHSPRPGDPSGTVTVDVDRSRSFVTDLN